MREGPDNNTHYPNLPVTMKIFAKSQPVELLAKTWNSGLRMIGKRLLLFLMIVLTYQYLPVHFYHFPEATIFHGDSLYNPYASMEGEWLQCNFHTHAYAWGGLTNGHQDGKTIIQKYQQLGYDVIAISDYYKINEDMAEHAPVYIPAYEHGSDLNKTHRLVLGTEEVDYYDILYSFNSHFKQFLIDHVNRRQPDVIAINHPGLKKGHDTEYLKKLTGYELLEILNRHRTYTPHWDSVLSLGKPVWLIGNDDLHDLNKDIPGFAWTMVHSAKKANSVTNALAVGNAYGVALKKEMERTVQKRYAAQNENKLLSVTTNGMTTKWHLEKPALAIRLIGQNGQLKAVARNTDVFEYTFGEDDTYIRAEVENTHTRMYFNPVVRAHKQFNSRNIQTAQINHPGTFIYRLSILLIEVTLIWWIWGIWITNLSTKLFPREVNRQWSIPGKAV